jgi:peptidoglycan DL-endopeptidase CwlO
MTDLIQVGSKGEQVTALQDKLVKLGFSIKRDGVFGPDTRAAVEDLQSIFGYDVDGLVGPATQKLVDAQLGYGFQVGQADSLKRGLEAQGKKTAQGALRGAPLKRTLQRGLAGADVRYLQRRLNALGFPVTVDGKFGEATQNAVRALQQTFGYDVDGTVGEATHNLLNAQLGYGFVRGQTALKH